MEHAEFIEQHDMMVARRQAAELDITMAHSQMDLAMSRYRDGFKDLQYPVCLSAPYQAQLEQIRDWAAALLEKAKEPKE